MGMVGIEMENVDQILPTHLPEGSTHTSVNLWDLIIPPPGKTKYNFSTQDIITIWKTLLLMIKQIHDLGYAHHDVFRNIMVPKSINKLNKDGETTYHWEDMKFVDFGFARSLYGRKIRSYGASMDDQYVGAWVKSNLSSANKREI